MRIASIVVGVVGFLAGLAGALAPLIWPDRIASLAPWWAWMVWCAAFLALLLPIRFRAVIDLLLDAWKAREG